MVTTTIDAPDEQPDDLSEVTQEGWMRNADEDPASAVGAAVFSTPGLRDRVWCRITAKIENDRVRESDEMADTPTGCGRRGVAATSSSLTTWMG